MRYQVLSRKYRPQRFDEIVGQEHICLTLQNAIRTGRISHAYLFTGSRGIGKTSTARILAKSLNCLDPHDFNPCNICLNCQEITAGRSLDVLEIDGASNRGIDEIRELRENVKYPPINSKYRIYIIDEVHMLTKDAFNALLKTLEEPPKHVVFIFATTEPSKVLPTIISRCQRYDFHRIPVPRIVEQLKKITELEGIQIPDDLLMLIAKKADGGLRDSESMLDQVIAFSGDIVQKENVSQILGLIDYDYFFQIGDLIYQHDQKKLIETAREIYDKGVGFGDFFTGLSEHFRNLLISKASGTVEMLDLPGNVKEKYHTEKNRWSMGDLLRLVNIISDAQINLKSTLNQRNLLEFTLIKMGLMDKTVTLQDILENLERANLQPTPAPKESPAKTVEMPVVQEPLLIQIDSPRRIENKKTATPVQKTVYSMSVTEPSSIENEQKVLTLQNVKSHWEEVLKIVMESNHSLSDFLKAGTPTSVNGNVLEITYDETTAFARQNTAKRAGVIEKAIEKVLHQPVRLRCIESKVITESTASRPIEKATEIVLNIFNGEIIVT